MLYGQLRQKSWPPRSVCVAARKTVRRQFGIRPQDSPAANEDVKKSNKQTKHLMAGKCCMLQLARFQPGAQPAMNGEDN